MLHDDGPDAVCAALLNDEGPDPVLIGREQHDFGAQPLQGLLDRGPLDDQPRHALQKLVTERLDRHARYVDAAEQQRRRF